MSRKWTRSIGRVLGWVCVSGAIASTLAAAWAQADVRPRASRAAAVRIAAQAPRPKAAEEVTAARAARPIAIREQAKRPGALVYAPARGHARRVTVMLHGMCDEPEVECPHFAGAVTRDSWLVCPRATLRCDGGGSIWPVQSFERDVEASLARVAAEHPDPGAGEIAGGSPRTLLGFSLGAIRGMDLAHAGDGRWEGAMLIGAKIFPDARRLRAAGVKRLLLAAGDHDMMKWHMSEQARRLVRQGYPAAFMSLGKIGHWFPSDFEQRLARGLAWVHGDDDAFEPRAPGEVRWRGDQSSP